MTTFPKQHILSPEDIKLGTKYSFTYSPCDARQFFNKLNRLQLFKLDIAKVFIDMPFEYDLYLESSRTGRLHLHGFISFNTYQDINNFYTNKIHKLLEISQVEMDTINDLTTWLHYCTKQYLIYRYKLDKGIADSTIKEAILNIRKEEYEVPHKSMSQYE